MPSSRGKRGIFSTPNVRMRTKWRIAQERRAGSGVTLCELCHQSAATDLHEVVNRSHYPSEAVDLVPDALLALLCNNCNTRYADLEWARIQLLRQNYQRYGKEMFHAQVEAFAAHLRTFDPFIKVYEIVEYLNL